ncbi:hypothetical protein QLL95_gp0119 [Cotonvirus japonicus]|uniref:Uncharacterized protein n=1 Tax=Cotonvirus japonicus TaxID=2811091 RepID=A0ABM7NR20_9VIRU|nr:hypothetical protein QLL95_gp0119 [Cotonvirus japonicus]BCS82608.1 hypothetical protein [Cotonvirus japonicus]
MEFLILPIASLVILLTILFIIFFVIGSMKLYKYLSFWKKIIFLSVLFLIGFAIIFTYVSPIVIITHTDNSFDKPCSGYRECVSPTKCVCIDRTLYGYVKLYCWNNLEKCLMINWDYLIFNVGSAIIYPFYIIMISLPPMAIIGTPITINNQCSTYNNVHHHNN